MIDGKRVLALIPARGGSKGIPLKNIQPCAGKPLITWTIDAARASKYVDFVAVTSDSKLVRNIAAQSLAYLITRPDDLSADECEMAPVIEHALSSLEVGGYTDNICVLLQPTSPLRSSADIDSALELLISSNAKTLTSVYESYAVPFIGVDPPRRQERKPTLMLNGAIYAFDVARFKETHALIDRDTVPYVMPQSRSVDVDHPLDMAIAAMVIAKFQPQADSASHLSSR